MHLLGRGKIWNTFFPMLGPPVHYFVRLGHPQGPSHAMTHFQCRLEWSAWDYASPRKDTKVYFVRMNAVREAYSSREKIEARADMQYGEWV